MSILCLVKSHKHLLHSVSFVNCFLEVRGMYKKRMNWMVGREKVQRMESWKDGEGGRSSVSNE